MRRLSIFLNLAFVASWGPHPHWGLNQRQLSRTLLALLQPIIGRLSITCGVPFSP